MLTGLSSVCILTTGALVAPAMLAFGMPRKALAAFLAIGGVLGMIASTGQYPGDDYRWRVDMPYIGFEKPLLLAGRPLGVRNGCVLPRPLPELVFSRTGCLQICLRRSTPSTGRSCFLPLVIVIGLMVAIRAVPQWVPDFGIPLVFVIGTLAAVGTGERVGLGAVAREGIRDALPVMSILVGVGMLVQIMTLTGVRGFARCQRSRGSLGDAVCWHWHS